MLSIIEKVLLIIMIFTLMIGVGCSLDKQKLKNTLKAKRAILTGLSLQYLMMPSLAILLISFNDFPGLIAYSILLIACCPGGSTSNMFTYLSKGNTELSIFLTIITTSFALMMTPLLLNLFSAILSTNDFIKIPLKNIFITLSFILLPVLLGSFIKYKNKGLAKGIEKVGTKVGYISMIAMIGIWYPKLYRILKEQSLDIFLTLGALSFFGITFSYFLTKFINIDSKTRRALSFEAGIQNAPLAFAIIMLSYPKEVSLKISWIPLVYGALSVGNSIFYLLVFKKNKAHQVQYS